MKDKRIQSGSTDGKQERAPEGVARIWPSPTRVGFRFAFLYLGLYAMASQIFSGLFLVFVSAPPNYSFRNLGHVWPMRDVTSWVARRVFGEDAPLVFTGNSGDSTFYWAQIIWILVFALIGTIVW